MDTNESVLLRRLPGADDFAAWAELLRVLAHPSRLMIVDTLSRGACSVRQLTEVVGHDMSTVSKHLTQLREAGIVEDERRGKQIFCRLRLPCVLHLLHGLETIRVADRALVPTGRQSREKQETNR